MSETNWERLKIIEQTPYMIACDVLLKDFKWLVEQAKKGQLMEQYRFESELHLELYEKTLSANKKLEQADERYSQQLEESQHTYDYFKKEINRLREALEFYADEENYDAPYLYTKEDNIPVHDESKIDLDFGKIARNALKELR